MRRIGNRIIGSMMTASSLLPERSLLPGNQHRWGFFEKSGAVWFLVVFWFFISGVANLYAQSVQVSASASASDLFYGDSFRLTIEVTSTGSIEADPPDMPDLVAFRYQSKIPSRGSRISIVNGATTRSVTFTYVLTAIREGNHIIPPLDINVNNQWMKTQPISIRVVRQGAVNSQGEVQLPSIFVALEPAVKDPVVGQQVLTEVVLYFKDQIEVTSFRPGSGWQPDSFWKEDLESLEQPRAESTIYKGQRYRKATLLRYALFPSLSGTLELPPFPLTLTIRDRTSRNDPFGNFFGRANSMNMEVLSEPVTLQVRPMPSVLEDAIEIYAVGTLQMNRSISKTTAVVGESIELITTIEGAGNIPLINRPEYAIPEQFDMFNPREISNLERKGTTIQGKKQFTEFLIPRAPGEFTIPAERLAFYNPETREMQYVTVPSIPLTVRSAPSLLAGSESGSGVALRPVRGLAIWHYGERVPVFRSWWFWVLTVLPLASLVVAWRVRSVQDRFQNDRTYRRRHQAGKKALRHLADARAFAGRGEGKEAYRSIEKGLAGYISDQLNLPEAGLSAEELLSKLPELVDSETRRALKILLDRCTSIGYAPPGTVEETLSDVSEADALLKKLQGWLS